MAEVGVGVVAVAGVEDIPAILVALLGDTTEVILGEAIM